MEARAVTRVGMSTLTRDPDVSDSSPSSSSSPSLRRKAGLFPGSGDSPVVPLTVTQASQDVVPGLPSVCHQRL